MSEMKLIMENWGDFLNESKNEERTLTWGQLKLVVDAAQEASKGDLTAERKNELLKILGKEALDLALSFGGPVLALIKSATKAGAVIAKMFKLYAQKPDPETENNPILALFNLDDGYQDLIDDNLEDKFIEYILPQIEIAAEETPDALIDDMDVVIQGWLAKQALGQTKVTGRSVTTHDSAAKPLAKKGA
jgi:hypothetical protein